MSGSRRENGLEAVRGYTDVKSVRVSLEDQPVRWYDDGAGTQRLN